LAGRCQAIRASDVSANLLLKREEVVAAGESSLSSSRGERADADCERSSEGAAYRAQDSYRDKQLDEREARGAFAPGAARTMATPTCCDSHLRDQRIQFHRL
jgi:hypothetical protein